MVYPYTINNVKIAVDAGLNNFIATHYKAHHMSWLHSFWGVGATFGPFVMAQIISEENSWRNGYLAIAGIQFGLVVLLFLTLPMWDKGKKRYNNTLNGESEDLEGVIDYKDNNHVKPLQIKGVKLALISFLFYCGIEATIGLLGSSFLVDVKDLPVEVAAQLVSLYYAGITIGRFITGFIAFKVNNRTLIRIGQIISLAGAALLFLPLLSTFSLVGFIMVGLGLAPIFPCMLHETPARFGKGNSQTIMGYQVAYTGSTFMPPLIGSSEKLNTILNRNEQLSSQGNNSKVIYVEKVTPPHGCFNSIVIFHKTS